MEKITNQLLRLNVFKLCLITIPKAQQLNLLYRAEKSCARRIHVFFFFPVKCLTQFTYAFVVIFAHSRLWFRTLLKRQNFPQLLKWERIPLPIPPPKIMVVCYHKKKYIFADMYKIKRL